MRSVTRIALFGMLLIFIILMVLPEDEVADLEGSFDLEATYDPRFGMVTIHFDDITRGTTGGTLEIQGLPVTYHKTFSGYTFTETERIGDPPSLGWAAHPVTVTAEHPEFGTTIIKTEIYIEGEERPEIILGRG